MKLHAILTGLLVAALAGLSLVGALAEYARLFQGGIVLLGLYLAVRSAVTRPSVVPAPVSAPEPVAAPVPAAPAVSETTGDVAVVAFLGALQEQGRLLDFLMDDITAYADAQVGAAARVVHQGCRSALGAWLTVEPVATAPEGSTVTVPAEDPAGDWRLSGRVAGEPPFSGTLVHRGWKTTRVRLPRVLAPDGGRLPAIAPAQVEVK